MLLKRFFWTQPWSQCSQLYLTPFEEDKEKILKLHFLLKFSLEGAKFNPPSKDPPKTRGWKENNFLKFQSSKSSINASFRVLHLNPFSIPEKQKSSKKPKLHAFLQYSFPKYKVSVLSFTCAGCHPEGLIVASL